MDKTNAETSTYKTDELGQTIDNVKIKDDQISIIKNANANFFVSPAEKASVKSVVSNVPKSINIIENDIDGESALPKNILELRKVEYAHEQDLKDKMLEKLSIKLEKDVDASVAKRKKSRRSKSDFANINIEESTTEDFDITDTNNFNVSSEKSKSQKTLPISSKELKDPTVDPDFGSSILEKSVVEQPRQMPSPSNPTMRSSVSQTITENPTSDETGFFDVDVHDITAVLKQTSTQNIKAMEDKNIARNINIPVINNEDFTISNTVNDFNKPINRVSTNQVHIDNSYDDTTVLVNNLLSEMNKVNNKSHDLKDQNFDDFYD